MKGIIIKDCLDCPYSDIKNPENNGGILICEIGKSFSGGVKLIDRMALYDFKVPDWCQLDDLQEIIEVKAGDIV